MKKVHKDLLSSLKTGGKLFMGMLLIASSTMVYSVIAAPPGTPYNPGETLQPGCAPGDANCTVVAPAKSGINDDITQLTGLTTALSVTQGGTGLSSISAGSLLYASALNTLSELGLDPLLSIVGGNLTLDSDIMVQGENVSLLNNDAGYLVPGNNVSSLTNDANYVSLGDNVSGLTNDANYVSLGDNISGLTNDANYLVPGNNVSALANDASYISLGENVSGLTNDANYVSLGDNVSGLTNDAGYLTSESDPVFTASAASGIGAGDITNWNTAYGWGDHSTVGYLLPGDNVSTMTNDANYVSLGDNVSGLTNDAGYLTTESDPIVANIGNGIVTSDGAGTIGFTANNSSN